MLFFNSIVSKNRSSNALIIVVVTAWMYVGMIGGYIFILIQLVLLIDFAYNWSESW